MNDKAQGRRRKEIRFLTFLLVVPLVFVWGLVSFIMGQAAFGGKSAVGTITMSESAGYRNGNCRTLAEVVDQSGRSYAVQDTGCGFYEGQKVDVVYFVAKSGNVTGFIGSRTIGIIKAMVAILSLPSIAFAMWYGYARQPKSPKLAKE